METESSFDQYERDSAEDRRRGDHGPQRDGLANENHSAQRGDDRHAQLHNGSACCAQVAQRRIPDRITHS